MTYQISRGGQTYGPYTLEELQRYTASGNISPTDMARSEGMSDWVPVSQILGVSSSSVFAPPAVAGAPAGYIQAASDGPAPPNLSWGLVLLFAFLTCGLFSIIWDFVQASWVKRVNPRSKAFNYLVAYIVVYVVYIFLSFGNGLIRGIAMSHSGRVEPASTALGIIVLPLAVAMFVLIIMYRFAMRDAIEQHFRAIGLRLGGGMTFFFGGLYFQYHFDRINQMRQAASYQGL
ncbi:MAG: DUF4339 domain-containing protein [Acidobacteriaceae bacterium]|nr:DUF4339 domain-containing protein [Acidobacteriaceae bacterium]